VQLSVSERRCIVHYLTTATMPVCTANYYNYTPLLLLLQVTAQHASLRLGAALRAEGLGLVAGAPSKTVVTVCTAALQRAAEVTSLLPAACRRSEWIGGATAHPATFAGS
jgi:hypothetical protein